MKKQVAWVRNSEKEVKRLLFWPWKDLEIVGILRMVGNKRN